MLLQQYLTRLERMFDLCELQKDGKTKTLLRNRNHMISAEEELANRKNFGKIFAEEEMGRLAGLFSEFEAVVAASGGQLFTEQQVDDFSYEMEEWIFAPIREGGAGVKQGEDTREFQEYQRGGAGVKKGEDTKKFQEYQRTINKAIIRTINKYKQVLVSAFINRQSSRGDTALHQAVKHRKLLTIDWLLKPSPVLTDELAHNALALPSHNALALPSMSILNVDHLTAFTLAAREARQGDLKIMKRLIDFQKNPVWNVGSVALTQIDLEQIDTFRIEDKEQGSDPREEGKGQASHPDKEGVEDNEPQISWPVPRLALKCDTKMVAGQEKEGQEKEAKSKRKRRAAMENFFFRLAEVAQGRFEHRNLHQNHRYKSALEVVVRHDKNVFITELEDLPDLHEIVPNLDDLMTDEASDDGECEVSTQRNITLFEGQSYAIRGLGVLHLIAMQVLDSYCDHMQEYPCFKRSSRQNGKNLLAYIMFGMCSYFRA